MWIDESEHVDALAKHSLNLTPILFKFDPLSMRQAIFKLTLVDGRICICETHLSLALLDPLHILSLVFYFVEEEVCPLTVLLPLQKSASVCASRFTKHALIGKQSITVKFTVIRMFVLLARLTPPFQFPTPTHSILVTPFETVPVGALPTVPAEKIVLESALISQMLVDVPALLAFCLVVGHPTLKVSSIG